MIPDTELEAMRLRAEKATPGPWRVGEELADADFADDEDSQGAHTGIHAETWLALASIPTAWREGGEIPEGKANAAFIAHARTDMPRLLDEIAALRAQLAKRIEAGNAAAINAEKVAALCIAATQNRTINIADRTLYEAFAGRLHESVAAWRALDGDG